MSRKSVHIYIPRLSTQKFSLLGLSPTPEGQTAADGIYRIEADIKGLPAEARLAARIERTKSKMEVFEKWLAQSRALVLAKSPTSDALKYLLSDTSIACQKRAPI